jgi:hypothetical protein
MPQGRRTKLTPTVQETIVQTLNDGSYFEVACQAAGISVTTGKEWLQRGRGEHPTRPKTNAFAAFAAAVEKAQAQEEAQTIARIKQAGRGGVLIYEKTTTSRNGQVVTERRYSEPQWTADAWRMERKHAPRWAKRERYDLHLLIQREAEQLAQAYGLTAEEIIAEAEAILAERG